MPILINDDPVRSDFANYTKAAPAAALYLTFPSLALVFKYAGLRGSIVYVICSYVCIVIFQKIVQSGFVSKVSPRGLWALAGATFLAILVAYLILYPLANSGKFGPGSDQEDSMNIGVQELLHGRYPYYSRTYLGNFVAAMPGELILSAPWVLLGNSAYQNIFWLLVFFLVTLDLSKNLASTLSVYWLILVICPAIVHQVATGSDDISNSIYVCCFCYLVLKYSSDPAPGKWKLAASAILLGLSISSRSNFVLVLPLLFAAIASRCGLARAALCLAIASATCVIVTGLFYFYDPGNFTPLTVQRSKVTMSVFPPWTGLVVPLCGIALAIMLSFTKANGTVRGFLRNCARVQAFLVVSTFGMSAMAHGLAWSVQLAGYGVLFLPFAVLGTWDSLVSSTVSSPDG